MLNQQHSNQCSLTTRDSSTRSPNSTFDPTTIPKKESIATYIMTTLLCLAISTVGFTIRYIYTDILKDMNTKQKNIITCASSAFAIFTVISCVFLIKNICCTTTNTVEPVYKAIQAIS